jgi:ABC-type nitrate/sulfonate/bicarbonate transport system substrate-binding protein
MSDSNTQKMTLPPEQQAIGDKCIQCQNVGREMKRFKDIFRLFVLSLFVAAVLRPGFALAQAPYVLNAAGFDADAYGSWPVLIAQEKGLFARDGIQLRSIRTDKAMMGLLAGSFEVINGGT